MSQDRFNFASSTGKKALLPVLSAVALLVLAFVLPSLSPETARAGGGADLAVTITDSPDPVTAPGNVTYTVTVTNLGPDSASGVVLTVQLSGSAPPLVPSQGSCTGFFTVTCQLGSLANGAGATVTATKATAGAGTIYFTATAQAQEPDPNPANNSFTQATTVNPKDTPQTDLEARVSGPESGQYGAVIGPYAVTVTNHGPADATDVKVTLFKGGFWASITPVDAVCDLSGLGVITGFSPTCTVATLPNGATATVAYAAIRVDTPEEMLELGQTHEGWVEAKVEPRAGTEDPASSNNTAQLFTKILTPTQADLGVTIAASPDPGIVGQDLTYTITVTNQGPDKATSVRIFDQLTRVAGASILPLSGSEFVGFALSQGTCKPIGLTFPHIECAIGDVAVGASASMTVILRPTAGGIIATAANVWAFEYDANMANNAAERRTRVFNTGQARLSVTITHSPDPVVLGKNVTYTVTIRNIGTTTATGLVFTARLAAGVNLISRSSSIGTSCGATPAPPIVITCTRASLIPGASTALTIVLQTKTTGGLLVDGDVFSNETDPDPGDNTAVNTVTVNWGPTADLSVTKTAARDPAIVGQDLTYTIRVTNNGPDGANGVSLKDDLTNLLKNAALVSITPSQGTCSGTALVTCSLGAVANGGTATITIVVKPTAVPDGVGTLTNAITNLNGQPDGLRATEPDVNWANNATSVTTRVITTGPAVAADLLVTKSDSPDPITAGQNLTYTIAVTNRGPSPATGVVLTDTLPLGAILVSATPSQGTCNTFAQCQLGTLSVQATATVTVVVIPTVAGTASNRAEAKANQPDPIPGNNVDLENTTVNPGPKADLEVTKTDSPDPVNGGQELTYTVTAANKGPSAASGVTLTDDLSTQVTFVSATPSQGAPCTRANVTVTCQLGALASGANATVTIVVTAPVVTKDTVIFNTARVASDPATSLDPTTANNQMSIATTVKPGQTVDTTPPVVTPPGNVTAEATSAAGAAVIYPNATATDNVGVTSGPTCTPASGATFPLGPTTVTCTASDGAGNSGSATFTVTVVDTTPPTIAGSRTPEANVDGWNSGDVTVHFDCADSGSGVASCTPDTVLNGEGRGQSVAGSAVDGVGKTAQATVGGINIDKTGSAVAGSRAPGPDANGWNNGPVTVTFEVKDPLSGPDVIPIEIVALSLTSAQPIPVQVSQRPGTSADTSFFDVFLNIEGKDISVRGTFQDKAGNRTPSAVSDINIDKTPPAVRASATAGGKPYAAGAWTNQTVTVSYSCSDALSGLAGGACPASQTFETEGDNQSASSGDVCDLAGNCAGATFGPIRIDKTPPRVTVRCTPGELWPPNHKMQDITVSVSSDDSLSGVAGLVLVSVTSNEPDDGLGDGDTANDIQGWTLGTLDTQGQLRAERSGAGNGRTYTLTYQVTDRAGNVGTGSCRVVVPHDRR